MSRTHAHFFSLAAGLASVLVAVGCAPADVAGDYTIALTNGENGCMVNNWDVGTSTSGVPVLITQDGGTVQATVNGTSGTLLNLVVGSMHFNGDIAGDRIAASLIGDNNARQGECSYTFTVDMDATVSGDVIQGELTWRPVTNGHPDCGVLETCRNRQTFNGTRPPSVD